jgi:hypothetical protein
MENAIKAECNVPWVSVPVDSVTQFFVENWEETDPW